MPGGRASAARGGAPPPRRVPGRPPPRPPPRVRPRAPAPRPGGRARRGGRRPRRERRPAVLLVRTHPTTWTESGAWWEVGVPAGLSGRADYEEGKARQQRWLS